jgi:hypothetical protein
MRKRAGQDSAFLNIPYDRHYESIYLAFRHVYARVRETRRVLDRARTLRRGGVEGELQPPTGGKWQIHVKPRFSLSK